MPLPHSRSRLAPLGRKPTGKVPLPSRRVPPPVPQAPVYFVWVQKASYLSYAFSALIENEFTKVAFIDPTTGERVPGMDVFPPALVTGLTFSQNVGVLAAQVVGMEALKLFAFNLAHYANLM